MGDQTGSGDNQDPGLPLYTAVGTVGDKVLLDDGSTARVTTFTHAVSEDTNTTFTFDEPRICIIRTSRHMTQDMLDTVESSKTVEDFPDHEPDRPDPTPSIRPFAHTYYLTGETWCQDHPHGQWSVGYMMMETYFHHRTDVRELVYGEEVLVQYTALPDPIESPDWEYPSVWTQYLSLGHDNQIAAVRFSLLGFGWGATAEDWSCVR